MTYPIVLAHGVCRFDTLLNNTLNLDNNDDPELDNLHYFKGIRTMLKQKGYIVYHAKVAWAAGVEKRSDDLKENLLNVLKETRISLHPTKDLHLLTGGLITSRSCIH